jgi:hypothetical protein
VHAYILDTGIRLDQGDFGGRAIKGIDEVNPGGSADDCNGHGTFVAGTVGGTAYGVAKQVTLVAVRVLGCDGSGSTANVVAGIDWVTANAIKPAVANISFGGAPDPTVDAAVTGSIAAGISYAVAAGNDNADACTESPADVHTAITVAATDTNDNRADFSNFGTCVALFAPGVGITSDWNTSTTATQTLSGTSMATPHVTGAAALILSANPTDTPAQVATALTTAATPSQLVGRGTGSPDLLLYMGAGPTPLPNGLDFDMSTPGPGVVWPGATPGHEDPMEVNLTSTFGGPLPVTLSASGLPAGVTPLFFSPVSIPGTAAFEFTVATNTVPGRYSIAIDANDGPVTHALTFTLIVSTFQGSYYPVSPQRILDTRDGTGAPLGRLGQGGIISLQVTGSGGGEIPATGVAAVVLNVTATNVTAPSYLTVYPSGAVRPTASSVNMVSGWTGANLVTVGVGPDGKVDIYNNHGLTDVIADVVGLYTTTLPARPPQGEGAEYHAVTPQRVFDSRDPSNGATQGAKVPGGFFVQIPISYGFPLDQNIEAFVVNVTVANPNAPGYATAWNGTDNLPGTSTLNYQAGDGAVPNMAIVSAGFCCGTPPNAIPSIAVYTQSTANIIVDIMGVMTSPTIPGGLRFSPQTPVRIVDTRIGQGASKLGPATTAKVTVPGTVAPAGTLGLATNVTAVSPTATTYVSVWPADVPGLGQPFVSNLNPNKGEIIPNAVYTLLGPTNAFNLYNNAGSTDMVVDVVGTFWDPDTAASAATAARGPTAALSSSGGSLWRLTSAQTAARLR